MSQDALFAPLRASGARVLLAVMWCNWLLLLPAGLMQASGNTVTVMVAGLFVLIPSLGVARKQIDVATRCALGIATAVFPALFVALAAGHQHGSAAAGPARRLEGAARLRDRSECRLESRLALP